MPEKHPAFIIMLPLLLCGADNFLRVNVSKLAQRPFGTLRKGENAIINVTDGY